MHGTMYGADSEQLDKLQQYPTRLVALKRGLYSEHNALWVGQNANLLTFNGLIGDEINYETDIIFDLFYCFVRED